MIASITSEQKKIARRNFIDWPRLCFRCLVALTSCDWRAGKCTNCGLDLLNIELFKKIREKIATAPEAYDQRTSGREDSKAPCGTAACIAGWAVALSEKRSGEQKIRARFWLDIQGRAIKLMGISDEDARTLFNPEPHRDIVEEYWEDFCAWPEPFRGQWARARGKRGKAQVAARYLDHIIETGKVLE